MYISLMGVADWLESFKICVGKKFHDLQLLRDVISEDTQMTLKFDHGLCFALIILTPILPRIG